MDSINNLNQFKCVECKEFLRVPVQLNCGCRICLYCFNTIIESGRKQCPSKDEECIKYIIESNQVILRDKACENEMKKAIAECPNKCGEIIPIYSLSEHLKECKPQISSEGSILLLSTEHVDTICKVKNKLKFLENIYNAENQQEILNGINEIDNKIENLKKSIIRLRNDYVDICRFTITLEKSVFVWPIYDFQKVYKNAKNNNPEFIISDSFYISDFGYKMAIKLFPNGNGQGRNTHLSLYFVLVKGKYDPLLDWPFKEKITLELIGHKNKVHSETFKSSRNSVWAQKPENEMNIAVGNPKFIEINKILNSNEFLINESLFIKARIHYF